MIEYRKICRGEKNKIENFSNMLKEARNVIIGCL